MMCLLSATSSTPGGGTGVSASSGKSSFTANGFSVHSPDSPSSSSSDSSSNPSPPQLSPQIRGNEGNGTTISKESPIYLDLNNHRNNKENEEPLVSPPMALLTPQLQTDPTDQPILTEEPKVVTSAAEEEEDVENTSTIIPERKKVPFTFCNMRQNIFDIKKKRGRKSNKELQKNNPLPNTTPKLHSEYIPITSTPQENTITKQTNANITATTASANPFTTYGSIRKRKISNRAESIDDPYNLSSKRLKLESPVEENCIPRRRRASAHPELKLEDRLAIYDFEDEIVSHSYHSSDSDDSDLHLQIDDEEDEQQQNDHDDKIDSKNEAIDNDIDSKELVQSLISSILKRTFQTVDLSVPLIDMFQKTPLNFFKCNGCTKSYSYQDSICVDLKCQTMHVTCSQCSWWTYRQIGVASKSY